MARRQWDMVALRMAPAQARRFVRDFCEAAGLADRLIADIVLCVSEAVSNVVLHAYHGSEPGKVALHAHVDDHLCIHVRDDGLGMTPRADSPGLGMGLPIIAQLAESLEVRTPGDGGTEIIMKFELG